MANNAIDLFVLARLEDEEIFPSPPADRNTLIRRLSLDLRGLPPTLEEVDHFVRDQRPDAYERLVDRYLASPRFGERWARHWLDVGRFADSEGNEFDPARSLWKYRDWVVDALNCNMPFDQFTIEQLAGDMLPNATREQHVATGFHCSNVGPSDAPQAMVDRVNLTGTAFLGLTVGCAQCHSHKFDPISQPEYYQLYAFFNNTLKAQKLEFASPEELAQRDAIRQRVATMRKELEEYGKDLATRLAAWENQLTEDERTKLQPETRAVLAVAADKRTDTQKRTLLDAFKEMDSVYRERLRQIDELAKSEPKVVSTLTFRENPNGKPHANVFVRGVFTNAGEAVEPGVPAVLPPLAAGDSAGGDVPNRLDLARWIVSPNNPLTPRVTVNRVWQRYFGLGLVETENDFGTQGALPTHPRLLDWLAGEWVKSGWDVKALHRWIVTSSTYRQSSHGRVELMTSDPRNRLLARQSRLRLEAEIIRDQALAVSGLLCVTMGGPPVFPYQVEGVMDGRADKSKWIMGSGESVYRRGLYIHFWRLTPHPFLKIFDAPSSLEACTRRSRSNTPLQALTILNDPWFVECARHLADRILRETAAAEATESDDTHAVDARRIAHGFQLCLARSPNPDEIAALVDLLADQRQTFRESAERAQQVVGAQTDLPDELRERAAWTSVARALLNLDEGINRE